MKYCPNCGTKLAVVGNFCSECGAKMPVKEVMAQQPQHIATPKIAVTEKIKNNIELMLKALEQNDPDLAKEYYKKAVDIDKETAEIEVSKYQKEIAKHFENFAKAELDFFKAMLEEWKRPKYPYLPNAEWKSKMQIAYRKARNAVNDWILFDKENAESYYTAGIIEKIYSEMRTDYYSHDRKKWFAIDKRASGYFDKALEIDPNFEKAKRQKEEKKSYCFIATAAYKTPFAYEIDILRNFRDEKLKKRKVGGILIRIYYKISPPIADLIEKSEKRRLFVRKFLNPVVKFLK